MEIIGASIMNGFGDLSNDIGCQPSYQVCEITFLFILNPCKHALSAKLVQKCAPSQPARWCSLIGKASLEARQGLGMSRVKAGSGNTVRSSHKIDSLTVHTQAEDAVLAVGPLVANHFGARFALLAWSGAGILRRGRLPP